MKKVFFIAAFVLVSAGVFAQVSNDIYAIDVFKTSDGKDTIFCTYNGKYNGQQSFNESLENYIKGYEMIPGNRPDMSGIGKALTKAQWDIVRQALDRRSYSTGDTYSIINMLKGWSVTVEFTSATQYKYWTFAH